MKTKAEISVIENRETIGKSMKSKPILCVDLETDKPLIRVTREKKDNINHQYQK